VAIDLGDRFDIHPAQKQEVGRRLARAAKHVIYGDAVSPSGPVPVAARRNADAVVVEFADVSGRLQTYSGATAIGFELCDAQRCEFVTARPDASRVTLDAAAIANPQRVRFCWANSPICNLYDESGLPAGPFEIAVQER
jgi:sialate O-acetylesterase